MKITIKEFKTNAGEIKFEASTRMNENGRYIAFGRTEEEAINKLHDVVPAPE